MTMQASFLTSSAFINGYISAALWSSTDFEGKPLDDKYRPKDISSEAVQKMIKDCEQFLVDNEEDLLTAANHYRNIPNGIEAVTHAGHDFWLTRNRHGSGFWDGDLPDDLGKRLTEAAHKFKELDFYPGDDGKLYLL